MLREVTVCCTFSDHGAGARALKGIERLKSIIENSRLLTTPDFLALPAVRCVRIRDRAVIVRAGWWRWLWRPALRRIEETIEINKPARILVHVRPWWW